MGRSLAARMRGMRDPEARGRSWAATGADWLQLLGEMKGAAMKLGQLASQYEDLLPKELADALRQLQRDAPPRSLAEMEPVMAAAWTPSQRARIVHIAEPAAAAARAPRGMRAGGANRRRSVSREGGAPPWRRRRPRAAVRAPT